MADKADDSDRTLRRSRTSRRNLGLWVGGIGASLGLLGIGVAIGARLPSHTEANLASQAVSTHHALATATPTLNTPSSTPTPAPTPLPTAVPTPAPLVSGTGLGPSDNSSTYNFVVPGTGTYVTTFTVVPTRGTTCDFGLSLDNTDVNHLYTIDNPSGDYSLSGDEAFTSSTTLHVPTYLTAGNYVVVVAVLNGDPPCRWSFQVVQS